MVKHKGGGFCKYVLMIMMMMLCSKQVQSELQQVIWYCKGKREKAMTKLI